MPLVIIGLFFAAAGAYCFAFGAYVMYVDGFIPGVRFNAVVFLMAPCFFFGGLHVAYTQFRDEVWPKFCWNVRDFHEMFREAGPDMLEDLVWMYRQIVLFRRRCWYEWTGQWRWRQHEMHMVTSRIGVPPMSGRSDPLTEYRRLRTYCRHWRKWRSA